MKLLAVLLALALSCAVRAQDASFEKFWQEDVAINERLLAQNKLDVELNQPLHRFPQKNHTRRAKRATDCPPGYTGLYCESPICGTKKEYTPHDIRDTMIEKVVIPRCDGSATIYIDSHLNFVRISVQTNGASSPGGSLYTKNNTKVAVRDEQTPRNNIHNFNYVDLVAKYGAGVYSFATFSSTDEDCVLTAYSATPLVVYGGFIQSPFDDDVQEGTPDGKSVQRNPVQSISSYFAFTTTNSTVNDVTKYVSFHRRDTTEQQFVPLPVSPRYNCKFDRFVGPYTCLDSGLYLLKVRGMDDSGNVFQRVYHFDCDAGENVEPTPSTGPILQCKNGGTLIKQKGQNVCYCGDHFTGPTCENKVCDNGGTLGSNNACNCDDGFSGAFCQHVKCTTREENFNLETRGITFVVRAHENENIRGQIRLGIEKILNYYDNVAPGFFSGYTYVLVVNGQTKALTFTDKQQKIIDEVENNKNKWEATDQCEDKIFAGIDEALDMQSTLNFLKSPVILFTDATSNDDDATFADLRGRLGVFKNPVFTIFYGGGTDNCNVREKEDGYLNLQFLSQLTGGLLVHVNPDDTSISDTAYALAVGFFSNNLLGGYDLINSCQYAPKEHVFFVDESVQNISVVSTGPAGFKLHVIDTNENVISPIDTPTKFGNLNVARYTPLTKGHYRLAIDTAGQFESCVYRIYAQTNYEVFFGATTSINVDRAFYQPIYNQDVHLVGIVNRVDFPDPENIFAEIVIWAEDFNAVGRDTRKILYASNGVYRDDCSYNLYFGQWKCTEHDQFFYVNIYVTDSTGFTVLRTTTGQCTVRQGLPDNGCRNGGVLYKGQCICTAGWKGDKCQTAVCYNGGTGAGDHCDCLTGYGGVHCQLYRCVNKNEDANFKEDKISYALVVQKSKDLVSALLRMNDVSTRVVHNLQSTHKGWIDSYSFWEFDNATFDYQTKSPSPEDIITEVGVFLDSRQNDDKMPYMCKGLKVLDVLIAVLTDATASRHMIVDLYVYGGMQRDLIKQKKLYELIDTLEAKIHVIQKAPIPCYPDLDNADVAGIAGIAYYSGGTYSTAGDGNALLALPLRYSTGNVYDENRSNCTGKQSFYFPVDSETQTISIAIYGDIKGEAKFTPPGGKQNDPIKVFSGQLDRLYVAMRGCPDGWQQSGERCYRFEPNSAESGYLTWEDARSVCFKAGGVLATITDAQVDNLFSSAAGGYDAWIGLNDIKQIDNWVWDEGIDPELPLSKTTYRHFQQGEPNSAAGRCVAWNKDGWRVKPCDSKLSFICSTHAFNLNYDPGSETEGHLPRGLWNVEFTTYADDELPCGLRIDAQSAVQVYKRITSSPYEDDGEGQATLNSENNIQVVHVSSNIDQSGERSTLEYAHFYEANNNNLQFVSRLSSREHCSYEYISDPYKASLFSYVVGYTGFDAYGYPFQRIIPQISVSNEVSCQNGGIKVSNENRCVCPPGYTGKECTEPVCVGGPLAPNKVACLCGPAFAGSFCEQPKCTSDAGREPPPITNSNKTFTLILDGSFTGRNKPFLNNFKTILDTTLDNLQGSIPDKWFKNYAAIFAYGSDYTKQSSDVIVERNRGDFTKSVVAAYDTSYNSSTKERRFIRSLIKIMNTDAVEDGSPIYIITDSAISDANSFSEHLYNLIAKKHVTINTIILGEDSPPGGKPSYSDPTVEPLIGLTYATGGGYYQTKDNTTLPAFWTYQLASLFSSASLTHSFHRKCSDKTEYFQIGDTDENLIADIFSPLDQQISFFDPNGVEVKPKGYVPKSKTNYLVSVKATKPGIWRATITHKANPGFCSVAIRSTRSDAPAVGFNTDTEIDGGKHSQQASYAPSADTPNAIIAASQTDTLRYVHIYDRDAYNLVFTSPLIKRATECKWNYVSKFLFECPASSFTVAVEGYDSAGHQFRRLYKTHCLNYDKPAGRNAEDIVSTSNIINLIEPIEEQSI